jgi:hypothetical protein
MTIADVMSRVDTIGQLVDQAATPTVPAASSGASSSFGAALASATSGTTASSAQTSAGALQELQLVSALGDPALGDPALDGSDSDSDSDSDSSGLDALTQALTTGGLSAPGSSLLGSTGLGSLALGSTALGSTALGASGLGSTTAGSSTSAGSSILAAAESQIGVTEQPPGSNTGPQLDTYRAAVAGAQPGEPWCAYFASWAAAQGGEPLGADGQGLGSVAGIADWAQSTGRLLPASATPAPGDLMLFGDRHVGIVESVSPDGSLTTVEGNYANAVSRVHRSPSEATGYVQL